MAKLSSESKLEQAIDFSLGLLDDDETQALLKVARNDPELETMMRHQCSAYELSRAEGLPDARQVSGEERVTFPTQSKNKRFMYGGVIALAASIMLFISIWPPTESPQLWLPVEDVLNTQRSGDLLSDAWLGGVEFYADGDLDSAIALLQSVEAHGAVLDLRNLYLASALLNAGRIDEAEIVMADIDLDSLPHPWRDKGYELQRLITNQ